MVGCLCLECVVFGVLYFGEKGSLDRFDIFNVGGFDDGLDFVGLFCKLVVCFV